MVGNYRGAIFLLKPVITFYAVEYPPNLYFGQGAIHTEQVAICGDVCNVGEHQSRQANSKLPPFGRQCDILSKRWSALLCQKECHTLGINALAS